MTRQESESQLEPAPNLEFEATPLSAGEKEILVENLEATDNPYVPVKQAQRLIERMLGGDLERVRKVLRNTGEMASPMDEVYEAQEAARNFTAAHSTDFLPSAHNFELLTKWIIGRRLPITEANLGVAFLEIEEYLEKPQMAKVRSVRQAPAKPSLSADRIREIESMTSDEYRRFMNTPEAKLYEEYLSSTEPGRPDRIQPQPAVQPNVQQADGLSYSDIREIELMSGIQYKAFLPRPARQRDPCTHWDGSQRAQSLV